MLRVFNNAVDRVLSNGRNWARAARTAVGRSRRMERRLRLESLEDRRLMSAGLHGLSSHPAHPEVQGFAAHVAPVQQSGSADPSGTISSEQAPVGGFGPQVINVNRYGYHHLRTVIVLTFNAFNEGLNPATAQDVNNYTITPLRRQAVQPQVILALYRPADVNFQDQVTLFLNGPTVDLHRPYTLTVNGSTATGVSNKNGVLIDGAGNGTSGTNFSTTLLGFFGGRGGAGAAAPPLPALSTTTALRHRGA